MVMMYRAKIEMEGMVLLCFDRQTVQYSIPRVISINWETKKIHDKKRLSCNPTHIVLTRRMNPARILPKVREWYRTRCKVRYWMNEVKRLFFSFHLLIIIIFNKFPKPSTIILYCAHKQSKLNIHSSLNLWEWKETNNIKIQSIEEIIFSQFCHSRNITIWKICQKNNNDIS